jgi:predicted DNA binding CopG/RHH family protein
VNRNTKPLSKARPSSGYHSDIDALKATLGQDKEKTRRFNAEIPASLHAAIKKRAIDEGLHMNELAAKVFNEYLSKRVDEQKKL